MPDKWDQYASVPDKWDQFAEAPETPQKRGAMSRFVANFADTTGIPQTIDAAKQQQQPQSIADAVKQGLRNAVAQSPPSMAVKLGLAIARQSGQQLGKAYDTLTQGDYPGQPPVKRATEAAGYAASGMLPVVGPMAAKAGEQIGSGDLAGGLGTATGAIAQVIAPSAGKAIKKAIMPNPERLYGSALKPAPSIDAAQRKAIIQTGLKEGIVLDPDVVDTVQGRIDALNSQISQEIEARSAAGAAVDPQAVAQYTDRSRVLFGNQVNKSADVGAIQNVKNQFLEENSAQAPYTKVRPGIDEEAGTMVPEGEGITQVPQPIPLASAQKMKSGTYNKLKYGEVTGAAAEAQKDLARGLKDQIVQAFPEIAQLNARESALLNLEASLTRFAGRQGNKQLIGLGTPMVATAAHAIGAPVAPATLLKAALDNPEIKSRIAIAVSKANPARSVVPGAVSVLGNTQTNRRQTSMPPPGVQ